MTIVKQDLLERVSENNGVLTKLLSIASKDRPLEVLLEDSLGVLLSLSWLSLLPKAGVFLTELDVMGKERLKLIVDINIGDQIKSRCAFVEFGKCLCGKAAQSHQVIHSSCIDSHHEINFEEMEPHGHYNIPILSEDTLLGVLVFYLPHGKKRDESEIEILTNAASIFALMISLRRKQYELESVVRELGFQKKALDEHAIVSIANVKGDITYANDKFCKLSGFARGELIGQNHRILKSGEHSQEFYVDLWNAIANGNIWHGDILNHTKQGLPYWVRATIVPFLNKFGKPYQYVAVRTDITQQKQSEAALQRAQLVANIGNWSYDLASETFIFSSQLLNIYGFDENTKGLTAEVLMKAIHPDDLPLIEDKYQKSLKNGDLYDIKHRIIHQKTGETRWVHAKSDINQNVKGDLIHLDGVVQDITETKMAQDNIKKMALTDHLTGLANRNQFFYRYEQSQKLATREGKFLALMLLDVDYFKQINDTYGHQTGDAVLKAAAEIFKRNCREVDIVSRLGGDEFAILLIHPGQVHDVVLCAERILSSLAQPLFINGQTIKLSVSIGLSFSTQVLALDEFIRQADLGLYEAKHNGRNRYFVYNPSLEG